jgi:hypothetical protein
MGEFGLGLAALCTFLDSSHCAVSHRREQEEIGESRHKNATEACSNTIHSIKPGATHRELWVDGTSWPFRVAEPFPRLAVQLGATGLEHQDEVG